MTKIAELEQVLGGRTERIIDTKLGDIRVHDSGASIDVGNQRFALDEQAENALCTYIKAPRNWLAGVPTELKVHVLRYELNRKGDASAVLDVVNDGLIGVRSPHVPVLNLHQVAEVLTTVFDPEDELVDFRRDQHRVHADVITHNHRIEVPNPDRIPGRPEVGDVTHGGVSVLAFPGEAKAPSVGSYFHRYWCRNGARETVKAAEISIKGVTVPDIIREMEEAAQTVLGTLDEKLARLAETAQMPLPGSPSSFAFQITQEARLGTTVTREIMDSVAQLPANASLYDVQQVFTRTANRGLGYSTQMRLQEIGGSMALDAEHVLHRCVSCERTL